MLALLEKHFGYTTFRPGQQEVISALLTGKDVIALLPTGMGKSLCYQLPGYIFQKPILIISPLLSLMQDQVEQIKRFGEKRVIALNSFLNKQHKRQALDCLAHYRYIFISPEMLMQRYVQQRLKDVELSCIVVDEAHCISQWGYDFRPDYLRIEQWLQMDHRPPVLALSATATNHVLADIKTYLQMKEPFQYIHSVDRPNIRFGQVLLQHKEEKLAFIAQHVQTTAGPGIIYTQSRVRTEQISAILMEHGIRVAAYHAGLEQADRQFIQQQFIEGHLEWIVATNAFGMGVHKSNIRQVIHECLPATIANYMQEVGRAGRDGEDALAILLYVEGDAEFAKLLVTDDLPRDYHVDLYMDYTARQQHPSQMLANGQIGETAFRVLHYWVENISIEQTKNKLEQLRDAKRRAIDEMMQLIQQPICIREQLVQYFGQTVANRPNHCCQRCGMDYHMIVKEREQESITIQQQHWQQRLTSLLIDV